MSSRNITKTVDGKRVSPLKNHNHKGQAMVEMIFTLILFVILLAGLIGFSLYLYISSSFMTAAREGARYAAADAGLSSSSSTTVTTSENTIRQRVKDVAIASTGISLTDANITITGPTGSIGDRTVKVEISYNYVNSLSPMGLLASYSGSSVPGDSIDATNIHVSSLMRYEE